MACGLPLSSLFFISIAQGRKALSDEFVAKIRAKHRATASIGIHTGVARVHRSVINLRHMQLGDRLVSLRIMPAAASAFAHLFQSSSPRDPRDFAGAISTRFSAAHRVD